MGEYVSCCVQVKLPTSWGDDHSKPRIIAELDDVLSDGFISWPAADDQATMWEVDGEACGLDDNHLSVVLDHLVRLRVPFVAASEAKWEIEPELHVYDGNEEGRVDRFLGYDRPLIDLNDLERLGSFEAARAHLAAGSRHVDEFNIDHLPATEPTDDERDDEGEG